MKRCSKCGIEKDESEFHKNKNVKDGLQSYCKHCMSEYDKYKYIKNKEHYSNLKKEYRASIGSNNAEMCKEWREKHKEDLQKKWLENYYLNKNHYAQLKKVYHIQNKDALSQYQKEYYKQNKERILSKAKNYYKQNRERILKRQKEYDQKKKLNTGGSDHTASDDCQ